MTKPKLLSLALTATLLASATAMAAEPVVRIYNWFDYIGPGTPTRL